jgi:hypothetical protein
MQFNLNITHLSQFKATVKRETELGIGEAVIPIVSLESGIPGSLASLHSSEKGTKGFVQSVSYILKNLGVDVIKTRALCFKLYDTMTLLEIGKRFLLFLPSIPALFQKFIIEPPTLIKLRLHKISLMPSGIESIFKSFVHCINYILNGRRMSSRFIPPLKEWAFSA